MFGHGKPNNNSSPDRCPAQSAAVKTSYPKRSTHVRATCDAGLRPFQQAHGHSMRVDPDRPAGGLLRNRGHRSNSEADSWCRSESLNRPVAVLGDDDGAVRAAAKFAALHERLESGKQFTLAKLPRRGSRLRGLNGGNRSTVLCHDDLVVLSRVAQPLPGFFIQFFEMHSFHAVSSCLKLPGFSSPRARRSANPEGHDNYPKASRRAACPSWAAVRSTQRFSG